MALNKTLRKIFSTGVLVALVVLSFNACSKKPQATSQVSKPKPNEFGLAVDGLIEVRDTIQTDETLSDILLPHGVSQQKINEIAKKSLNVFPLRSFRADDELYIYAKWDSVETVKYLVYQKDPINYVVFDLRDTINIYKKQKPVTIKQVVASGVIKSSLFQTLQEKNINLEIASRLEDIYGWQIDFFHIQPSDSFKVIYEEILVDGVPVDVGKILAANFNYHKQDYYAFYYNKEKGDQYFDEKGNSLKRMFLKAPLKYSRISSRYSLNRYHPILHRNKAHLGTDYAAPTGTPIMSVGNGVVVAASYTSGNGNFVKIKHNATYTTQYLHMSHFAKGIHPGVRVTQGQVIGYVGSTGLATGPHVCFRFWKNGKQVDPMREKYQSAGPVSKKNKSDFDLVKKEWMEKLNASETQLTAVHSENTKSHG